MGSMNWGATGNPSTSQTSSLPPAPSLTGFSFQTIGKQPGLLSRLGDAPPGPNGTGQYDFSPSPSPDLEEQLLMPAESSSGDSDAQRHPSTRRNQLLDALAPDIDVEMDDINVKNDDVNPHVGANPGPNQMSSSTPLISRLHSGSTPTLQSSHGLGFNTPHNASSQLSSGQNEATKNSSAKIGSAVHAVGASPAFASSGRPPHHPSVPPTPPPEVDGPSGSPVPKTMTPYDSLRAIQTRLQSFLDTGLAGSEDFDAIRELAQVAKVGSTSVSVASQKAVTLAQRALAAAQDAMSASQDCVKLSHTAKARWEAAIQGCEKFMEQRSTKLKQQQDAFKNELASLGESIKSLEETDRKREVQREAGRKALEEKRACHAAATAVPLRQATPAPAPITSPPSAQDIAPAPIHPPQPNVPIAELEDDNARQYVLADEFDRLRREVEELRKFAQNREEQPKQEGDQKMGLDLERQQQQHGGFEQQSEGAKQVPEQQQRTAQLQQPSQPPPHAPPAPPLPHRKAPAPPLPPTKPATDPRILERELKERLKSHKKLSIFASSSSSPSSAGPSTPTLPQDVHMRRDSQQSQQSRVASSASLPNVKQEPSQAKAAPIKVKAEEKEGKVPPPLPHRRVFSASPMQLEYPPPSVPPSVPPPTQCKPHNPPPLRIPRRGIVPSPVKDRAGSGMDSDDSPIYLHRQGSDPGNLPLVFTSSTSLTLETPPQSATSLSSMASMPSSAGGIKPEPVEDRIPPPVARTAAPAPPRIQIPQTQPVAHPPIATLSAGLSPVESSSSSSVSVPSFPGANQHPAKKNKGKGKAHRVTGPMSGVSRPPASAQLPPRPTNGLASSSQATQTGQSAPALSNSVPPSPINTAPAPTQHRPQHQDPASAPQLPLSRGPENNNRRSGPPFSRPPPTISERRYVPDRSPHSPPPTNRRPRTPVGRPRIMRPPRGDHYSPARGGRGRSASPHRRSPPPRSSSHSPDRSGFASHHRSPPPHNRRVMQPYKRPNSPDRGAPVAGMKRPLDDTNNSTAPAPVRRRVEEQWPLNQQQTVYAADPPSQRQDPGLPHQQRVEERDRNAEHSGFPGSSARPTVGPIATLPPRQSQATSNDQGPGGLASRLSDARVGPDNTAQVHQLPRQRQAQHQQNRGTPPSRNDSPTSESASVAPSLLQRFEGSGNHQTSRGAAQNASRGSRGAHRGGRGRGGGGGGQPHQSLSNRISSGAPAVSLLQRIDQS